MRVKFCYPGTGPFTAWGGGGVEKRAKAYVEGRGACGESGGGGQMQEGFFCWKKVEVREEWTSRGAMVNLVSLPCPHWGQ